MIYEPSMTKRLNIIEGFEFSFLLLYTEVFFIHLHNIMYFLSSKQQSEKFTQITFSRGISAMSHFDFKEMVLLLFYSCFVILVPSHTQLYKLVYYTEKNSPIACYCLLLLHKCYFGFSAFSVLFLNRFPREEARKIY